MNVLIHSVQVMTEFLLFQLYSYFVRCPFHNNVLRLNVRDAMNSFWKGLMPFITYVDIARDINI